MYIIYYICIYIYICFRRVNWSVLKITRDISLCMPHTHRVPLTPISTESIVD